MAADRSTDQSRRLGENVHEPHDLTQRGNIEWWAANPMCYDWRDHLRAERYTPQWFDAIDANFIQGARLFAHGARPFDRIIPFHQLGGKRVLEIGCGMGLHSELMLRAGAEVTSIDITDTAITATTTRLALKGLRGDVRRVDAERLPFEADTFDFIWSWGVIHHSARTGRIVREIARVLKPASEARLMVYNRDGAPAWTTLYVRWALGLRFLTHSFDEQLNRATDGFTARYYTRDQFEDLLRTFFDDVSAQICGQEADAIPLPRGIRRPLIKVVAEEYLKRAQGKRGGFIFAIAARKS